MTREEAITELQRMAATIEWDYPLEAQIYCPSCGRDLDGATAEQSSGVEGGQL